MDLMGKGNGVSQSLIPVIIRIHVPILSPYLPSTQRSIGRSKLPCSEILLSYLWSMHSSIPAGAAR